MSDHNKGKSIKLALNGELPEPITCPCCADPVTLDQLQGRKALLVWAFDAGVIAVHRHHLVNGNIMATGRVGLQIDQAIVDREASADPPLDTPPGSR